MVKSKPTSKISKKSKKQSKVSILSPKEQAIQKRKAQQARKELIQFTTISLSLAAVLGIILGAVGGVKAALAAVAIPLLGFSYKYYRKAFWAFLIYLPFSGTVTYWVGGGNIVFQLAKDALYVPALIALIQECKRKNLPVVVPKGIRLSLGILFGMSLMTLLFVNASQQFSGSAEGKPIAMGILGLKVFMGYIPLIFCGYYLIRNKQELLFFTRLHVVLVIICCALGFMQYMMLVTGRCAGTDNLEGGDLFKATLEAKCFVGGALVYSPSQGMIRLPGTFVAPWQWAWFLIANAFFTFATAFSDPSPLWRIGGLIGMAAVFVNAVISGQRIALALVPTVIVILLVLTGQVANLKRFIPIGVGLGLLLGIAAAMYPAVVQERIDSFTSRWEASPPQGFIQEQFMWALRVQEGFFGKGLGRGTNSARAYGKTALIETYYPKVLYEVGPLGTIAFLVFVTCLTVITFKIYRSLRDKSIRSFGASFWVFILCISYNTYYYPLDVDPVAVYYWIFAGVTLTLPEIDRQEMEKRREALENESKSRKKGSTKTSGKRTVAEASG